MCTVDILRKFDTMMESVIPQLPTSFDDVSDPDGKSALIWMLGEYGEVHVQHVNCIDAAMRFMKIET